ncbi:MAG TPA: response regulator transcription factor [Catenuloplanes sp.]
MAIRVLVIGEGHFALGELRPILAGHPDIELVGHLGFDGDVAAGAVAFSPSVVLINTDYMVSQVLPTVADLRAELPGARLLMLVDPGKPGMLPPRRRSVGMSFLVRDDAPAALAGAIRRLAAGEPVGHPRLDVAMIATHRRINTRELEVLGLAAEGATVAEIAARLRLAPGTIRNYLSSVIAKTSARNRIDAIRIVRRDGWLR